MTNKNCRFSLGVAVVLAFSLLTSGSARAGGGGDTDAGAGGGTCPVPPAGPGSPNFTGAFGVQIGIPSCAAQKKAIDDAFRKAVKRGTLCLARHNQKLMVKFLVQLTTKTTEIQCLNPADFSRKAAEFDEAENDPSGGGAHQHGGNHVCGLGDVKGTHIYLSPEAFLPFHCGPLESTLFHEFLHNIGVTVPPAHDPRDLFDGVYGCEDTCFGRPPIDPAREFACSKAT